MIRIIGDVHDCFGNYLDIIQDAKYSVQLGDFGENYDSLKELSMNHKIIGGNHDNYESYELPNGKKVFHKQLPNFLGDYGSLNLDGRDIFFVRGAYSIDKNRRIFLNEWYEEEELTILQGFTCLELYKEKKPDIVLSHDCPTFLLPEVISLNINVKSSRTNRLLEAMYEEHQPSMWLFGHHHRNYEKKIGNTLFTCLDILSFKDI